jgi:hypothetical protein
MLSESGSDDIELFISSIYSGNQSKNLKKG